jgi:hypothetical protein
MKIRINIRKTIRLRDRKMAREGAVGMAHYGAVPLIELDPRQGQKERLGTLLHELLHIVFPDLDEDQTILCEQRIASVLWSDRWRRIEPDTHQPTKPNQPKKTA